MTNFKEDLLRFNQIWLDHPSAEKFYSQMGERLVPDIFIDENYELNYREINYAEKIRSLNYAPGAMRVLYLEGLGDQHISNPSPSDRSSPYVRRSELLGNDPLP